MKTLVIIDVQNDFVDGALGSSEARSIIDPLCNLIGSWKGNIIVTLDTHGCEYIHTREGQYLPVPHCIKPTQGWKLNSEVAQALSMKPNVEYVEKSSFGQFNWGIESGEIVIVGLVTDICVINNALIMRNFFPERTISVIEECCAGTSPENHKKALDIMRINHINIL
jgi:nicotinamidase-related amidase